MSTVIKIENVSKQYRLGLIGTNTLKGDLQRWWYNMRGLPDPTLMIGQENSISSGRPDEFIWALKDINLEVQQGEVLGIIGKNGAGKSTLLKLLSRVTAPTTGNIKIKGRIASLLEVGTGFHPELTGKENIFLNGAILGMTKSEIKSKFDEIIDFAGVTKYIDTPVKRYSSGMYVRLAFAVAAHLDPEILIVDEVLAVGDAEFQKKAIGKMQDVSNNEGRTVLFVSHNMASIVQLCQKCILLDNGKIIEIDYTKKVIGTYLSSQYNDSNGDIDLTQPSVRKNSLENSMFKWTRAGIINSKGEQVKSIELMEPFYITMRGILTKTISDLMIAFDLKTGMEFLLFNSVITDTDIKRTFLPGELIFTIRFDPNILGPGTYIVGISAKEQGISDWIPNAIKFNVEKVSTKEKDSISSVYDGVVIYPCKWSVQHKPCL